MHVSGTTIIRILTNSMSALVVTRRCFESRRDRLNRQLDELSSSCFFYIVAIEQRMELAVSYRSTPQFFYNELYYHTVDATVLQYFGLVVQVVRTRRSHRRGHRFES